MSDIYRQVVANLRGLMGVILEPHHDTGDFLAQVAKAAKDLDYDELEARVWEVDFIENRLYLRASTQVDVSALPASERTASIQPRTITGDAIIENRVIIASKEQGYARSRFKDGEAVRAAFPIEFLDPEMPEGRTRYVLVVDRKGPGSLADEVVAALKDYSVLAGLAISIKLLRDRMGEYFEKNRNLLLTGRHLASIAHDMRSLNIGVGGFLNKALRVMPEKPDDPVSEEVRRYLTISRDSSAQVETLLNSLSQFNRTEMHLNRDTDLAEAVGAAVQSLSSRDDYAARLDIRTEMPEGRIGYLVDNDWFGTVMENLIKNSVEACNHNGRVSVSIRMEPGPDRIRLIVEDQCGGIPPDMVADLFTPFRTTKKRGQGLGLANARKVVEEHGGGLRLENHSGQGAVFIIEFPLDAA